jgi:hypothetical protein
MKWITVSSSSAPLKVPVYDRTRDEFAMAALTGLLASNARGGLHGTPFALAAEAAYAFADAMLKQREAS